MAQRKATVDIDIKGLNDIQSLENALADINDEIKDVDVNSKAFDDLARKAQAADGKLRGMNEQLAGVTSTEKADGILKMGEGFAGAFIAVQGIGLALGKTNEDLEKTIAQVGGLIAALDGIKKVTEALSAQNLKFVKAAITGFKSSAVAAKLFGTATRAAITATGIGALVILLGTLIANFDTLKAKGEAAFGGLTEKVETFVIWLKSAGAFLKDLFTFNGKGFKGAREEMEKAKVVQRELLDTRKDYNREIEDTTGVYEEQKELLGLMGDQEQTLLDLERERNQAIVDNLLAQQKLKKLRKEDLDILKEAQLELKKIAIRQDKLNKAVKEEGKARVDAATAVSKAADEALKARIVALKSSSKQLELTIEQYQYEKSIVELLQKYITLSNTSAEDRNNSIAYATEDLNKQVISSAKLQEGISILVDGYDQYLSLQGQIIEGDVIGNDLLDKRTKTLLDSQINITKASSDNLKEFFTLNDFFFQDYRKRFVSLIDESASGEEFIAALLKRNAEAAKQSIEDDQYKGRLRDDYLKAAIDELAITKTIEELTRTQLDDQRLSLDFVVLMAGAKRSEQENTRDLLDVELESLKAKQETLVTSSEVLIKKRDEAKIARDIADANWESLGVFERSAELAKDREAKEKVYNDSLTSSVALQKDIKTGESAIIALSGVRVDINSLITEATNEENDALRTQSAIQDEIERSKARDVENQEKSLELLKEQSRVYHDLQDAVNVIGDAMVEQLQNGFDLINVLADNRLIAELERIETELVARETALQEYTAFYEEEMAKISESNKNLGDEQDDINEALRDANGSRFDELLERQQEVQSQLEDNAEREKNLANDKMEQEYAIAKLAYEQTIAQGEADEKAAKAEKAQAIILSIINTALAVVKSLPNVPLSVIAGILGAAGTVTIASQKIPAYVAPAAPATPAYLEDGGLLQGASHAQGGIPIEAEGGEFVINKNATESYFPLINAINEAGRRTFAEGGAVTTPVADVATKDLIDYDRMKGLFVDAMRGMTIVTELVPLSRELKSINKVQTQASIR